MLYIAIGSVVNNKVILKTIFSLQTIEKILIVRN